MLPPFSYFLPSDLFFSFFFGFRLLLSSVWPIALFVALLLFRLFRETARCWQRARQLATRSIEPSFGLLFGDLLKDMQVGTTGAAIIISMLDVMMNFSGLFVGPLLKEFSYRKVAVAGSLLCCIGLALTSPATSMAHILATYSVINGKCANWSLRFVDSH